MTGLSEQKIKFNYQLLKGRIGEAITERFFYELGFKVFRYGMENTLPGLTELIDSHKGKVIESIRNQPDFVVYSTEHDFYFIEVKYRKNKKVLVSDLIKYERDEILFVLISPGFIGCLSKAEVNKFNHDGRKYIDEIERLADNSLFNFSDSQKKIITQFERYAEYFLQDLPHQRKVLEQAEIYT